MHSPTIIALLAAAGLASAVAVDTHTNTIAKRGCYTGGDNWGANRNNARNFAGAVCANVFSANEGGKQWKKGDHMHKCYNLDDGAKVDFNLDVEADGNLGADHCYDELRKEIDGCDNGGEHHNGAFKFIADPNAGQCT